jgi:hypothetical protein
MNCVLNLGVSETLGYQEPLQPDSEEESKSPAIDAEGRGEITHYPARK